MKNSITETEIAAFFAKNNTLKSPLVEQTKYLVNGDFKKWDGPFNQIFSAVCTPNVFGELERTYIGKIPKTGLPEAMECLKSAEKAYDNGFGE